MIRQKISGWRGLLIVGNGFAFRRIRSVFHPLFISLLASKLTTSQSRRDRIRRRMFSISDAAFRPRQGQYPNHCLALPQDSSPNCLHVPHDVSYHNNTGVGSDRVVTVGELWWANGLVMADVRAGVTSYTTRQHCAVLMFGPSTAYYFTRMFEPRYNVHSNVRTNVWNYIVYVARTFAWK